MGRIKWDYISGCLIVGVDSVVHGSLQCDSMRLLCYEDPIQYLELAMQFIKIWANLLPQFSCWVHLFPCIQLSINLSHTLVLSRHSCLVRKLQRIATIRVKTFLFICPHLGTLVRRSRISYLSKRLLSTLVQVRLPHIRNIET